MPVKERTDEQDYHAGFLAAIAQVYAFRWANSDKAIKRTDWNDEGEICKFHQHDSASVCAFAERFVLRIQV